MKHLLLSIAALLAFSSCQISDSTSEYSYLPEEGKAQVMQYEAFLRSNIQRGLYHCSAQSMVQPFLADVAPQLSGHSHMLRIHGQIWQGVLADRSADRWILCVRISV